MLTENYGRSVCEIIQEGDRTAWKDGFHDREREREYVRLQVLQIEVLVWE